MSLEYIQFNGADTRTRTIPQAFPPVVIDVPPIVPWTRPGDWASMPTITTSDQKFAFLAAVFDDPNNWYNFSVTTSAGDYQVDWGDGSSPVTYSSGATATYTYDYSTVSGSPTSAGYKTVVAVVTAVSGNLTGLNMNIAAATGTNGYKRWLDIVIGSPNLTSLTILGSGTQNTVMQYLERLKIVSWNITNMSNLCTNLPIYNLELPDTGNVTASVNMFNGADKIQIIPTMNLVNITNAVSMFNNCFNVQEIPNINLSSNSNVNCQEMFANCTFLETSPTITGQIINVVGMYSNCRNLLSMPYIDTTLCNNFTNFALNCNAIKYIPPLPTGNVSNMVAAFYGCTNLAEIPNLNFSNVTTLANAFYFCRSLTNANLDLPSVTTLANTFRDCTGLTYADIKTNGSLTNTLGTFAGALSVLHANVSDTSNVTNTVSMYATTTNLIEINEQNYANVTNSQTMFNFSGIKYIPANSQYFPNTQNAASMFNNCQGRLTLANLTLGNVTSIGAVFATSPNLKEVNVSIRANSNSIGMRSAFANCFSLEKVTINGANLTTIADGAFMTNGCNDLLEFNVPNRLSITTDAQQSMRNNTRLRVIGPFEVTPTGFAADINARSVSVANLDPINGNTSLATGLVKSSLETLFGNLVSGNSTLRNITISGNPGVDTVVTKSSNTSNASNVVVIANTVGLSTGMLVTGNNISNGRAVTFQDTGDTVTLTDHGIADNTIVSFSTITTTTGISVYTPYYVVNTAANTFQVANSQGGSALALTTNGNGTLLYGTFIDTINANANIIVSVPASGTATGQTLTFSVLNTSIATLKNWSVTR